MATPSAAVAEPPLAAASDAAFVLAALGAGGVRRDGRAIGEPRPVRHSTDLVGFAHCGDQRGSARMPADRGFAGLCV
jgi:hypothetical protein